MRRLDRPAEAFAGPPGVRRQPARRGRPLPPRRRDGGTGGYGQHPGLQRPSSLGHRVAGGDEIVDDYDGSVWPDSYQAV